MALALLKLQVIKRSLENLSELWELSANQLSNCYRTGQASPAEVVDSCLGRIEALEPSIGAFRHVCFEDAQSDAKRLTSVLGSIGSDQPLYGIPVAVKELFDVRNTPGCYGSEVLANRVSKSDAEAVRRLREAGAIIIGVTRAHEFGWGITTQHKSLGSTRNPWNLGRVPGGSSGGSAAAVASGMVPVALASDTGGSIRIPAALCGIAGIKATYGRISKRGGVSLAPSMDHPGPVAREVEDLEAVLVALSGFDPEDSTTYRDNLPNLGRRENALNGITVGRCPDLHLRRLAVDHQVLFESTLESVVSAGGRLEEVSMPGSERIRPTFASIQMAEAYYVHTKELGTFPSAEKDYGEDVRSRLLLAGQVSIADYLAAMREKMDIRRTFESMFRNIDVLLTPVTAGGPSTIENPDVVEHFGEPLEFRDLCMDYTVPQDLTGLPVCVIPIGFDSDDLPVGVQVTAPDRREDLAFQVALEISTAINLEKKWPLLESHR